MKNKMSDNKSIKYDNPFESDFKFPLSTESESKNKILENNLPIEDIKKPKKIPAPILKQKVMSQIGFMCYDDIDDWIETKANERLYKRIMKKDKKDICNKLLELGIKSFKEIESSGKSPFEE